MFKVEYWINYRRNLSSNALTLVARAVICISVIGTTALPAGAVTQQTPPEDKEKSASEASQDPDESAMPEKKEEKSLYFRFNMSGALGIFRYETNWGPGDTLNEIGRYKGPGIAAALELGRQRKSGFAFGVQLQLGNFPSLNRFSLDTEFGYPSSEKKEMKYLIVGLVFLHHPFGLNNGFYFAIRPGISMMRGVPNYRPVPLPGFSVGLGYDFFTMAKAHLGVEAEVSTIFGRGGAEYDFSDMEMRARLISFGLAFTVAVY